MKTPSLRVLIFTIVALASFLLLMWSPWIGVEHATQKVTENLGGPEAMFNYLYQETPVEDVPKDVVWFPFARAVYFPGEAA